MCNLNRDLTFSLSILIPILSLFVLIHFNQNDLLTSQACGSSMIKLDDFCSPELNCDDLKDIHVYSLIGQGAVKHVYLAKWKHVYIALSKLANQLYQQDFLENIKMLKALGSSKLVTPFYGQCNKSMYFTPFYPHGSALNLPIMLHKFNMHLNINQCFKLCLSYLEIINYLHTSPAGVRVMCDSNSLEKILSQYLVDEDLNLIANDLDAIPEVTKGGVLCGKKPLSGSFVAPEQHWTYYDQPFYYTKMPRYDQKVDIWKIPDVCEWFLNLCNSKEEDYDTLNKGLKTIRQKCKQVDPKLRPSSVEVIDLYKHLFNNYILK